MFSSGPAYNGNQSDVENFYALMSVCGVADDGTWVQTHPWLNPLYKAYGSHMWLCAPNRAWGARPENSYWEGSGTSNATAQVSAVVALMRSVNPGMTWRDVKVALAGTARKNDPTHAEWAEGAALYGGTAGRYSHNPNYGFGVVDAAAAVEAARNWVNMPPMTEFRARVDDEELRIPVVRQSGSGDPLVLVVPVADDGSTTPDFVEHVEVVLHLDHEEYSHLDVRLVSPQGAVSRLLLPAVERSYTKVNKWHSFGAATHLGENPVGEWQILLSDHAPGDDGQLLGWELIIRGHRSDGMNGVPDELSVPGPAHIGTPAAGRPTISGTVQVGETLTANTSSIVDTDGLDNATFSYQWVSNNGTTDTDIAGATDSTYTLVGADEGETIRVTVSFTDDAGNPESLTSAATDTVAAKPSSPATGAPTISGTAQVGETLTADTSGVSDADGLSGATFSYQWISNDGTSDAAIQGATASTYTLADSDKGKAVKVRVSFTDDAGSENTLTSAATAAVDGRAHAADRQHSPRTGEPRRAEFLHLRAALQRGAGPRLQL